jgi:hypothetical protein
MIIIEQRKQYLRKSRKARKFELLVAKNLSANLQARVREKRGNSEKFYSESSLFIGVGGVVSRNCLDKTVARNLEDTCPHRHSEGDVFYQNSRIFMELDRLSQPASLRG